MSPDQQSHLQARPWTTGPWTHVCRGYNDAGNEIWGVGNSDDPIQFPVADYDGMGEPAQEDRELIDLAPDMAEAILAWDSGHLEADRYQRTLHDIADRLRAIGAPDER